MGNGTDPSPRHGQHTLVLAAEGLEGCGTEVDVVVGAGGALVDYLDRNSLVPIRNLQVMTADDVPVGFRPAETIPGSYGKCCNVVCVRVGPAAWSEGMRLVVS